MLIRVAFILGLMLLGTTSFAESCKECMAQCPHDSRDLKDCDRGCPEVCAPQESDQNTKVTKCEQCMSACPHRTRDIKPCDRGCPEVCDQAALTDILLKTKWELSQCTSKREPNSAEKKKGAKK